MGQLTGQSALITGASAGIGRASAIALAREGAHIIATGRRDAELHEWGRGQCRAVGIKADYLAGDITDENFISELGNAGTNVDILVNNAGILNYGPILQFSPDQAGGCFKTNVLAALRVAQVIGKSMAARRRGHIIVVTSGAARAGSPHGGSLQRDRTLRLLSSPRGCGRNCRPLAIRVSEVSPGMVDTNIRAPIKHPGVLAALKARTYSALSTDEVAARGSIRRHYTTQCGHRPDRRAAARVILNGTRQPKEHLMLENTKQKFVVRHYRRTISRVAVCAARRSIATSESPKPRTVGSPHTLPIAPGAAKETSKRHYHDIDFHMVYVLKGWIRSEFEGEGVHTMRAGSCWVQPPGIRHKVLAHSDYMELIEVISPAQFGTVDVE